MNQLSQTAIDEKHGLWYSIFVGIINDLKAIVTNQPDLGVPEVVLPPIPSKKVLIVEDEPALADALVLKFKHEGYDAFKAENGQMGLDMAIAQKPNIILLDLMMPVMDGKTMLKKLRDLPDFKTLPVLILTNAGDVDNIRETQTYYNANGFLIKSNVNPEDIVSKVKDLI
jgi:CheY-like chemotaxis protein